MTLLFAGNIKAAAGECKCRLTKIAVKMITIAGN